MRAILPDSVLIIPSKVWFSIHLCLFSVSVSVLSLVSVLCVAPVLPPIIVLSVLGLMISLILLLWCVVLIVSLISTSISIAPLIPWCVSGILLVIIPGVSSCVSPLISVINIFPPVITVCIFCSCTLVISTLLETFGILRLE